MRILLRAASARLESALESSGELTSGFSARAEVGDGGRISDGGWLVIDVIGKFSAALNRVAEYEGPQRAAP
jgi:hypothetical protein